jgi:hypothetical protein
MPRQCWVSSVSAAGAACRWKGCTGFCSARSCICCLAYGNIYSNQGAMTPGAGDETADGMSEAKIGEIIAAIRGERYRFAPVRRIHQHQRLKERWAS